MIYPKALIPVCEYNWVYASPFQRKVFYWNILAQDLDSHFVKKKAVAT